MAQKAEEMLAIYYDNNHNGRLDQGEFLVFDFDYHRTKIAVRNGTNGDFFLGSFTFLFGG